MQHPCKDCPDRAYPGCRKGRPKLQAWEDVKAIERKAKERDALLDGFATAGVYKAKRRIGDKRGKPI